MDKKKLLIIGGVVVVAGVAFFLYSRSKKKASEAITSESETRSAGTTTLPMTPVSSKLSWIQNQNIASHLSGVLNDQEQQKLRNWVNIIISERKADPNKWKNANNLTGQASDIGHALFQMDRQAGTSGTYWNDTNRYALQDA
jgi:hypothetical protein